MRILDGHADEEHVPGQGRPYGKDETALALIFPEHERLAARFVRVMRAEEGGGRVRVMPDDPDVPLHAAGEPRVAQREVGGLEDVVAEEELAALVLGIKRPEAASEIDGELRPEVFVLEHRHAP